MDRLHSPFLASPRSPPKALPSEFLVVSVCGVCEWLALALSFFRKVGAMRYIAQAEELLSYLCRKRLNSPFPSP